MKVSVYPIFLLITLCFSCSDDSINTQDSFFKIYDHSDFDLNFSPIDFVETNDGFIILSATSIENSAFKGIQLIKVDSDGNFEQETEIPEYENPIGEITLNQGDSLSYFFAMNPTSLSPVLLGINSNLELVAENAITGLQYPLASSTTSTEDLLLLSYDPINLNTELSLISLNNPNPSTVAYSIGTGTDVETDIINHFLDESERPLPFFCGEYQSGGYYFNGFYNFSFSLVFTDFANEPLGVVQGQSTDAGIRSVDVISANTFAVAGFQFSENFQLPTVTLSTNQITSSVDLFNGDIPNLRSYTPTDILRYNDGAANDYYVFGSEEESRRIILNIYDNNTGQLTGLKTIGSVEAFSIASMKLTADMSVAVLGTTYSAGRFERIFLNKISQSEFLSLIQ